jgi:hypothetical protein
MAILLLNIDSTRRLVNGKNEINLIINYQVKEASNL